MFDTLAAKVPRDKDLPERAWRLEVLRRVLHGELYDVLEQEFHNEKKQNGDYVPLRDRKPCVRFNLSKLVVQDAVALLFGEGHFPSVDLLDAGPRETLALIIKETRLRQVMSEAAFLGSVGSVVVYLRVLDGRLFFSAMETLYLTPRWQAMDPDTLESVTELFKIKGAELRSKGYAVKDDNLNRDFWFKRVWDDKGEWWYVPILVEKDGVYPEEVDKESSVSHPLGFVPMVWIRNLPGGKQPDGCCTFGGAIHSQIEIEYQLSQAGRGLKYSSDPTLLLKEPAGDDAEITRGAANAIVVSEKGDAKMLEINGTAVAAVMEYVRVCREMALESVHGNRSNADRVNAAQSGRAIELLHQALIWLADELRSTYGEAGLLPLINMVLVLSRKMKLRTKKKAIPPFDENLEPTLKWPAWFEMTGRDKVEEATALVTLTQGGLLSEESAIKASAPTRDIENVQEEMARIKSDRANADARLKAQAATVTATETTPS